MQFIMYARRAGQKLQDDINAASEICSFYATSELMSKYPLQKIRR